MVTLDGRFSQNLGGWKNWGWMEKLGVDGVDGVDGDGYTRDG